MRSYRPEELFDEDGAVVSEIRALAPTGPRRMSANPHANGGVLTRALELPDFRDYAVEVARPATDESEATRVLGAWLRDAIELNPDNFRIVGPDETDSNRLSAVFEATDRVWEAELREDDVNLATAGPGDGGSQRAPVPGLARGLPADRPARLVQLLRGVHPHRRFDVQPARQVAQDRPAGSPGGRRSRRSTTCSRAMSGARTTTVSRTRIPASSTTSSTRRRRSSGSTSRPTQTVCCRSPTTACAAATTST